MRFVAATLSSVEYENAAGGRVLAGYCDRGGVPCVVARCEADRVAVVEYVNAKREAWNAGGWPSAVWPNVVVDAVLRDELVYAPTVHEVEARRAALKGGAR